MNLFGDIVRHFRVNAQLTLGEASKQTGIPVVRLSALENHRTREIPTATEVRAIGRVYKIKHPHYDEAWLSYTPDEEGIQRNRGIADALEAGATDAEMLDLFGVFVCRTSCGTRVAVDG